MSMSARLKALLDQEHILYTVMSHSPAYTAQAAAASLHVPGKEVAKTVVLRAGDDTVLAVLPASYHVNLKLLAATVGKAVRLATEEEFTHLFPDCEPGAMPPFGEIYGLPVYVDKVLTEDEEIVFPAGTHRDAIRMRYEDFSRLAKPWVCSFAERFGKTHAAA
jgi:Ala-tRNA(Pro) deacylase